MQHFKFTQTKQTSRSETNASVAKLINVIFLMTATVAIAASIVESTTKTTATPQVTRTDTSLATPTPSPTASSTTTTLIATDALVLSSVDEFVDHTESPLLLFDNSDVASEDADGKLPPIQQPTNSSTLTTIQPPPLSISTRSTSPPLSTVTSLQATIPSTNSTTDDLTTGGGDNESNDDADDPNDDSEADRGEFRAPQNVSHYMDYIERLFTDLRHQIKDLLEPHMPQLIRSSSRVQLTPSCSYDVLRFALALRTFEPWALKMIDSTGKVPEGILEGTLTALGSYDQCISTVFGSESTATTIATAAATAAAATRNTNDSTQDEPEKITRGKYCLVTVSPFMPPKPPADKVERLFQEEAARRNYSQGNQFSRLSAMFYYMKFRIGVCIPSSCSPLDTMSIANSLSQNLRLNITIPHCSSSKDQEPLTRTQLFSGISFGVVSALVLAATLAHLVRYAYKSLGQSDKQIVLLAMHSIPTDSNRQQQSWLFSSSLDNNNKLISSSGSINNSTFALQESSSSYKEGTHVITKSDLAKSYDHDHDGAYKNKDAPQSVWLAFSVLTNNKLYFGASAPSTTCTSTGCSATKCSSLQKAPLPSSSPRTSPTPPPQIINCINGIRVISLCWVIIANSYITLDPRATRGLSKSRDAPKDFIFQIVVQASLAIETFFFMSGLLLAASFERKLANAAASTLSNDFNLDQNHDQAPHHHEQHNRKLQFKSGSQAESHSSRLTKWLAFYAHRYIRVTPATMLVIALSLFASRFGDGPLWSEATATPIDNCSRNWWRHALHVANWLDARQMCFVHYWYISADMQLFLVAPLLLLLLNARSTSLRRVGYFVATLAGSVSLAFLFQTTYARNLPPTLLFYSSDPESRREFANIIMTKPLTHALPYLVGMLLGRWLLATTPKPPTQTRSTSTSSISAISGSSKLLRLFMLVTAAGVALVEVFLPYRWNNSQLPGKLITALYASCFRLCWSLVLALTVVSCRHTRSKRCEQQQQEYELCFCATGGNFVNRLLSSNVFKFLSKLSFVAFLVHLPLMSVFVAQTRGLFAFSHMLVIHLALSYLVMTFALSFVLVHIIEYPFITLEAFCARKLDARRRGWRRRQAASAATDKSTVITAA